MKRRSHGLSFLGFVALADLIFAVSAGLLLLNPLSLTDFDSQKGSAVPDLMQLTSNVQVAEHQLAQAEQSIREVERALQAVIQEAADR